MMKGTISTILNWLRVPNTVYYVLSHFGQRFSESLRCCDRWIKSIEFNIIILEYILKKDHITWCKLLQTLWVVLKATENCFLLRNQSSLFLFCEYSLEETISYTDVLLFLLPTQWKLLSSQSGNEEMECIYAAEFFFELILFINKNSLI